MSEEHTTYLRKSGRSTVANARSDEAVRRAFATGAQVDVLKKNTVGNKSGAAAAAGNLAKLENETEVFKVNTIDKSVSKAIMLGRQQKELTQKALATLINEKPQVIQEFECGKALPNQNVLGKLERALNIRLRGANIGAPLK